MLIRGGRVFDGDNLLRLDILVQDGLIAQMGDPLPPAEDAEVVNARGCVLSPGFCDMHVHLREPGFEEKETIATGTAAAAAGGFTTVCAMPNLRPVPDDLEHLRGQLGAIRQDARVRVLPYGALTVAQRGAAMADIKSMAPYVTGFSDDGFGVQDEGMMRKLMRAVAESGRFVAAHCEVESLLPKDGVCVHEEAPFARRLGYKGYSSESEWREVERDIRLARQTGCRLHICHASTKQSFALVRRAKAEGLPVTCEATPHNLILCCEDINENNGRFKMNPPLRMRADMLAAQEALHDGTIDAIATDHAPHTEAEKNGGFSKSMNGVVGLETAFAACYTSLVQTKPVVSLAELLRLFTWRPLGILREQRQYVRVGEAANLTLVDLETEHGVYPHRFLSKGRSTPFEDRRLAGWPVLTLYGGQVVYRRRAR